MSESGGGDEGAHARARGNIVEVVAVVILIALGYLAFNYIDHQRKLQDCLASGRHNCEQWLNGG